MLIQYAIWRSAFLCICLVALAPVSQASQFNKVDYEETSPKAKTRAWKEQDSSPHKEYRESGKQNKRTKNEHSHKKPHPARERSEPNRNRSTPGKSREHDEHRESSEKRERYKRAPRNTEPSKSRTRSEKERIAKEREHHKHHPHYPRPSRTHERHYKHYSPKLRKRHHYHHHETYHYHTHYLAPIRRHYHPIGFHVHFLPRTYISIFIGGVPYFYFDGIFYRHHVGGYIVVRAPIGAVVDVLPVGFISFYAGGFTYYYVNDTYYLWDADLGGYVVVAKPHGADKAVAEATAGRLYVYPKQGQDEEQQARDRYECHRWAVHQTDVDPSLAEPGDISLADQREYKRAITACLDGRGYSVK